MKRFVVKDDFYLDNGSFKILSGANRLFPYSPLITGITLI